MKNKNVLIDINPDGMNLDEITSLEKDLQSLVNYLQAKELAMWRRQNGDINITMEHEKRCDLIYANLPERVKSW